MGRVRTLLMASLMVIGTTIAVASPASAKPVAPSYYVSLGDSLAQGVQPTGSDGAEGPTADGYPDQLFAHLKTSDPTLQLVKFGCSGETTTTLIRGGICHYGTGSQLTDAVKFLKANRGHIAYLTIDIGSNDVLPCVSTTTGIDIGCLGTAIGEVGANLSTILRTLRSNLDNGTVVAAGMTYYDPILAAWLLGAKSLAVESVVATDVLNIVEAISYLRNHFRVAPVAEAFHTNDFSVPADSQLPVNVTTVCTLTWMCTAGNIHPNKAGYTVIAGAFASVLRPDHRR